MESIFLQVSFLGQELLIVTLHRPLIFAFWVVACILHASCPQSLRVNRPQLDCGSELVWVTRAVLPE